MIINVKACDNVLNRWPNCIEDVTRWIKRMDIALCNTTSIFPNNKPEINIYLSDEVKNRNSGKFDIPELERRIGNLLNNLANSIDNNSEVYRVAKGLSECYEEFIHRFVIVFDHFNEYGGGDKRLITAIRRIVKEEIREDEILGNYDENSKRITLYLGHYLNELGGSTVSSIIRYTLAHEYFHLYHHQLCGRNFAEGSYEAQIVKEALADFFAYYVLINNDFERNDQDCNASEAHHRHYLWDRYILTNWPYAYARFIPYNVDRNEFLDIDMNEKYILDRFNEIIDLSSRNMHQAYMKLVPLVYRQAFNRMPLTRGFKISDQLTQSDWSLLKRTVEINDISSINDLQRFYGIDVIRVRQGRFIQLESGELLGAYPQIDILDYEEFINKSNM